MAVTLEQSRILLDMNMDPSWQQHALDDMRRFGNTRLTHTHVQIFQTHCFWVFTSIKSLLIIPNELVVVDTISVKVMQSIYIVI